MKLHIFNPDHETALAANKIPFTAPHAARQLRYDLGFIAATWASEGDVVVVEDKVAARESLKRIGYEYLPCSLIEPYEIRRFAEDDIDEICVWGWDKAVKRWLTDQGLKATSLMPSDSKLDEFRHISGRAWAAENILHPLVAQNPQLAGCALVATTVDEALFVDKFPSWVLKAPWSCSGRGVRYVSPESVSDHLRGWVANTIARQGYIMMEPFYTKIMDLAAEFYSAPDGSVSFLGLSLFETKNGAYTGNIIAPERRKREVVAKYLSLDILDSVVSQISALAARGFNGAYEGYFGVDMMVVADESRGVVLHPCVEMNLRRTMGYVALQFKSADDIPTKVMRISMDKKYRLRIVDSEDDIWK